MAWDIPETGWLQGSSGTALPHPPPARGGEGCLLYLPREQPLAWGAASPRGTPLPTCPAVPYRGTEINRKPCALAVARGRSGMCRWLLGCLFGVKAAGSCREEPGSTRPGIARELIATSRRSL